MSNRHRVEIIEVGAGGAAARFTSGRVEWIVSHADAPAFEVGQRGMVDFVYGGANGGDWTFTPFTSKTTK